jgi:pyridoxine 5-phosphate synthase
MPALLRSEANNLHGINLKRLTQSADFLLALCGQDASELSVLLVSDQAMQTLNRKYRHKDKPTNVLSFPMRELDEMQDSSIPLGDIVISADTATREAKCGKTTVQDRVNRLLVHGLVHLLGYDHERSDRDHAIMTDKEKELYRQLKEYKGRRVMSQLAINVDHVATLRQARGINEPDPVLAAGICELAGASGIVVHLREDRRHIQDRDVYLLRQTVKTKLNLEMGAAPEIIDIALDIKPDMITLVPEKRQELTTEGGLNVSRQQKKLAGVIQQMATAGIPVSLFIDPDPRQVKASRDIGATFVEIHTGRYCDAVSQAEKDNEFELVASAAEMAYGLGLKVNAGHGLNYLTTARVAALDTIEELSIGHAIMARAIFVGLDQAVREMAAIIAGAAK